MSSRPEAASARIRKIVGPCDLSPLPASTRRREANRSRTGGHLNAEETHRTERQDEHQDGEDQRFAPLAAEDGPAEHVDQADDESTDSGADDIADPAEHRGGERDDAEVEPDVPFEIAVVDAVD